MKKEIRILALLVCFTAMFHGIGAYAAPTLSIQPLSGDAADVPGWQPAIGAGISEMILETLEKSNAKIQVVDSNAAGSRKFVTADYILSGDVTEFTTDTNISGITAFFAKAHLASKSYTAHVAIAWRITDASGQRIIRRSTAFGTGSGPLYALPGTAAASLDSAPAKKKTSKKKKNSDDTSDSSEDTTTSASTSAAATNGDLKIGYINLEFIDSALGKAADATVSNIVAELSVMSFDGSGTDAAAPTATSASPKSSGIVLAAPDNNTIVVSVGSSEGFHEGDEVGVYQLTDIKNSTGKVVYTAETMVGTITLQSVQADRSQGSFSGNGPIHEGMTVKAR
jgi:hypothetical protein